METKATGFFNLGITNSEELFLLSPVGCQNASQFVILKKPLTVSSVFSDKFVTLSFIAAVH